MDQVNQVYIGFSTSENPPYLAMENYDIDCVNLTDAQYQYNLKINSWGYLAKKEEIRELIAQANALEQEAYKRLDDYNPYYGMESFKYFSREWIKLREKAHLLTQGRDEKGNLIPIPAKLLERREKDLEFPSGNGARPRLHQRFHGEAALLSCADVRNEQGKKIALTSDLCVKIAAMNFETAPNDKKLSTPRGMGLTKEEVERNKKAQAKGKEGGGGGQTKRDQVRQNPTEPGHKRKGQK